jgi:hypothetical protein
MALKPISNFKRTQGKNQNLKFPTPSAQSTPSKPASHIESSSVDKVNAEEV